MESAPQTSVKPLNLPQIPLVQPRPQQSRPVLTVAVLGPLPASLGSL